MATFEQIVKDPNHLEEKFTVHRAGLEHTSSNTIYFNCPFCEVEVKAYTWSICGGGKKCGCGAFFGSSGMAYKLPEKNDG